MGLHAVLYDNNLTTPSIVKNLAGKVNNIRLLWEIHGGLRSIECDWLGTQVEAFSFYKAYCGYRLVILDHFCDRPVADGFITGLAMTPSGVRVLANGAWFRHYDQLYVFDDTVQDSQQGTLSYEGTGEFRDTGQNFSDWDTAAGNLVYQIEVGNLGAYQENNTTLDTNNDFSTSGGAADREWYAQRFIPPQTANVAQLSVQLQTTGSPVGTITVSIYDEASGIPDAIVGSASAAVDISTLSAEYDWADFYWGGVGPEIVGGVPYFAVLKTAGYTYTDSTTELMLGSDADGGHGDTLFKYDSDADPTWTTAGTDHTSNYRVYPDSITAVSWGFMGAVGGGGNTYIKVYRDYAGTTLGWLGDDPTNLSPIRYTVKLAYAYKSTSDIVKDALTREVPAVDSDQDNIDETNTVIGFWSPPWDEGGLYPGELIEKLASMSDGSNNQWNYWVANQPLDGVMPQKPVAYFKAQVDDGTFDWQIRPWMLAPATATLERNIQELRNAVRVIYRDMDDDDALAITSEATDSDSISDYWRRETILSGGDLFGTGATQYRDLYLDKFHDALLGKSITITAPYLWGDNKEKWPLWYPIKMNASYFRIDISPEVDVFSSSWDREQVGQALTMEYSDAQHSLRIHLDLEPNDVDALLARITAFR